MISTINIKSSDINNYEKIGSGKFGTVYKVDNDTAYKIYHPYIPDNEGFSEVNPALFHVKRRIDKIKRRQNKIKHTDLPKDILVVDGDVRGVKITFFNGCVLKKLSDVNYSLKKNITLNLLRNHRELLDNKVYPTDYHLGNVMIVDGDVKIIDLDDGLTHTSTIPNKFFEFLANDTMYSLIYEFFNEYNKIYNYYDYSSFIDRERATYISKSKFFENFFVKKEEIQDYILIDKYSDVNTIRDLLERINARVLFLGNKRDFENYSLYSYLNRLKHFGISIYDLIDEDNQNSYFNDFPVKGKILIKDKDIIVK